MSHEVTLRWRLELGSSENLLHSCVVSGLKRLKKTGTAKAPHASLSLCSFSPWYLQRGGFRVARFFLHVTCRLKSPKAHILSEREPGGSQITSCGLAWKSQNLISPTLLVEADTKVRLIPGEGTKPHLSVEKCHCHAVRVRWGTWYSCLWKICSVRYQGRGVNLVPGIDQPGHWSWGSWTSRLS